CFPGRSRNNERPRRRNRPCLRWFQDLSFSASFSGRFADLPELPRIGMSRSRIGCVTKISESWQVWQMAREIEYMYIKHILTYLYPLAKLLPFATRWYKNFDVNVRISVPPRGNCRVLATVLASAAAISRPVSEQASCRRFSQCRRSPEAVSRHHRTYDFRPREHRAASTTRRDTSRRLSRCAALEGLIGK